MKSPISLLTFSSLSISACLLAQYMSSGGAEGFFEAVFGNGSRWAELFYGYFRLSSLFFGIFLYFRNTENRAEGTARYAISYYSFFSQILAVITPVLMFAHGAYAFSAVFSVMLAFFVLLLLFASPSQHTAVSFCGVPFLLFSVLTAVLSVTGAFSVW